MMREMHVWEPPEDKPRRTGKTAITGLVILVAGIALGYLWHAYHAARMVCE
jgi:multidrug resistance efflux pump